MFKRPGVILFFVAVLLAGCATSSAPHHRKFAATVPNTTLYQCFNPVSHRSIIAPQTVYPTAKQCPPPNFVRSWPVRVPTPPPTTTTTTTTRPVTTTTSTTFALRRCFGTPLTTGQADINANPTNTTFCLAGSHNWSLTPKAGDHIIGDQLNPGILDGGNSTQFAIQGTASNIILEGIEIKNYTAANQMGAINSYASNWILRNLQVHDNGTGSGGDGSSLGTGWQIVGGRYYNNRQSGFAQGGTGTTLDGVEIDHNNFTNDSYTNQNIDCNFEAGGAKWLSVGLTVKNSIIHDNACRGLWTDLGASNITITNNQVYDNWYEGIVIEISGSANITNNTVTNNGFHANGGGGAGSSSTPGCIWGLGGGITISTSGQTPQHTGNIVITGNNVTDNCNGITGIDSNRSDACGGVCELANLSVSGNTIVGSSDGLALNNFGWFTDDGDNLATHNIVVGSNSLTNTNNCQFSCS